MKNAGNGIVICEENKMRLRNGGLGMMFFKDSNVEAMAIVEKAKADALLEKDRIALEARKAREEEVKKAKEEIAQEIEASKDEVHKEIVSVALDASKKVLSREVNSKDNEKLIDDFIKDLDK